MTMKMGEKIYVSSQVLRDVLLYLSRKRDVESYQTQELKAFASGRFGAIS